jgi:hypothetical protein
MVISPQVPGVETRGLRRPDLSACRPPPRSAARRARAASRRSWSRRPPARPASRCRRSGRGRPPLAPSRAWRPCRAGTRLALGRAAQRRSCPRRVLRSQTLRLRRPNPRLAQHPRRAPLDQADALEEVDEAAERRPQRVQRARSLRPAVESAQRLRRREEARDMLRLERRDVVGQTLGLGPRLEPTDVPRVLSPRVGRAAPVWGERPSAWSWVWKRARAAGRRMTKAWSWTGRRVRDGRHGR